MLSKNDKYASPKAFADYYKVPRSWVYRHTLAGGLLEDCSIKLGKYLRIDMTKAAKVLGIEGVEENAG